MKKHGRLVLCVMFKGPGGQKFKILVPIGVCKNLSRPRNFLSPQQSENSWPHDHGLKWSSAAVNYRLWSNWRDFVISSSLFFLYFEVVSVFFSHNFLHTFFCISNFLFIVAPKKCISNKYKCALSFVSLSWVHHFLKISSYKSFWFKSWKI